MKNFLSISLICFFCVSCAHNSLFTKRATEVTANADDDNSNTVAVDEPDDSPQDSNIEDSDMVESKEFGEIKLVINRPVMNWIAYFQGRGRKYMHQYLERSSRYFPMMKEEIRREGLPENLVYVPLIESGLSPTANSYASAVGYWQFIHSTGKHYGLTIDTYIDERRDPVLSTKAAVRYFKALYSLFGDWYLALAAYNTGENRVQRAVMKRGTRNFWQLAKGRSLPKETRNYVPKFLAAMVIAKNPERYGFENIEYKDELSFDEVVLKKPISLDKLAKNMGMDYDDLKALNPKFRSDYVYIPQEEASMIIRVPKGKKDVAVAHLEESYSTAPKIIPNDIYWYRVRHGDTLSHIAMRNRTNVSTIRRLNNLGRRSFIRVGQRLKVPDRGVRRLMRASHRSHSGRSQASASVTSGGKYHTVQRGESLYTIAKKYSTSIQKLKSINRLGRRSLIRVGQRIKVKEEEASSSGTYIPNKKSYHVVRRGENLLQIAQRYRTSLDRLRTINHLGHRSLIYPGQKLKVSAYKNLVKYHVVKPGENLSLIASKYNVRLSRLARLNSIKSKAILLAGTRLEIP